MMRTSNPALNESVFRIEGTSATDVMTLEGTASKTMMLLGIVVLVAGIVWKMVYPAIAAAGAEVVQQPGYMRGLTVVPPNCWLFFIGGTIGGLVAAIVTIFKPTLAPISAPIYAAFEGLFLGAFSAIFEFMYPGIVPMAVVITFGTLATLLVAYRFRLVKATENFKLGVVAATGGIALVLVVLSSIGLLVGGIGVMNIMLISVAERTREIGVRMAVGARRQDVLLQVLIEAGILTGIGGVVGIVLGYLASWGMTYVLRFPFNVSPLVTVGAALFSISIGIFFGLYPANKAARMDPIMALGRE
jgi:uncharacterized YccA/Bax inhibitor family protein